MSRPFLVEVDCGSLRLSATPNGAAACPVYVYRDGSRTPIAGDTINLAKAKARGEFLTAHIPEEFRAEAIGALLELATRVDAARLLSGAGADRPTTARPPDEAWPDMVEGAELVEAIRMKIRRYVALPNASAYDALALWVLQTYVTDVSDYTPYIAVTSPVRECGKSTLLEVLLWLAYSARLTGGITAAALYRIIARGNVTMLLDELDTRLRGDGGEALRGVLNTGFHRSGNITICVGDAHEEKEFNTYCPKVLAGIGQLWDTVSSRSISIRMERASKEDLRRLGRVRGDRIGTECEPLRRQCLRWAMDNRASLQGADPDTPDALGARQADVWRPLLAIADVVGGDWPARARTAALALRGSTDDEGDFALLLLKDVFRLLGDRDSIFSDYLLKELSAMDDRPWSEYGRHDKPITARGLAKLLGRFGVKPGTVRIGELTGKGYTRQKLAPAFLRYIPDLSVTSVTTGGEGDVVTLVTDGSTDTGTEHSGGVIRRADGSEELSPERLAALRAERAERRRAQ